VNENELKKFTKTAKANKKKRSKVTIKIKIINPDTYKIYYEACFQKKIEKARAAALK